jgi:hypothetical protein
MGGPCDSEETLVRQLFSGFSAEILVLVDRLFYGYEMGREAVGHCATACPCCRE